MLNLNTILVSTVKDIGNPAPYLKEGVNILKCYRYCIESIKNRTEDLLVTPNENVYIYIL